MALGNSLLNLPFFLTEIYEGNYTVELGPDAQVDFPDTQSPLEIGKFFGMDTKISYRLSSSMILY